MLTNKYAEGYPGRRYYGGCEVVDVVEDLAIARAKELFGAEHANVQPHSGVAGEHGRVLHAAQAGRHRARRRTSSHGGHLTAGSPMNFSGKFYSIVALRRAADTERIDLDQVRDLARQHRPEADHRGRLGVPARHRLQAVRARSRDEVGAALMADIAHPAGLVAAGLHPSPVGLRRLRHHHHAQDAARARAAAW